MLVPPPMRLRRWWGGSTCVARSARADRSRMRMSPFPPCIPSWRANQKSEERASQANPLAMVGSIFRPSSASAPLGQTALDQPRACVGRSEAEASFHSILHLRGLFLAHRVSHTLRLSSRGCMQRCLGRSRLQCCGYHVAALGVIRRTCPRYTLARRSRVIPIL